MKKIQILALHLSYGGIEKAIVDLANNLAYKYDVEIISTYKIGNKPAYDVNKKVKVKYLISNMSPNPACFKKYLKSFRFLSAFKEGLKSVRILYLKKKLMIKAIKSSEADVLISTRIYHNRLVSKYGSLSKIKIAWEHNHHQNNKKYFNNVISSVKNCDYLVLVSKSLYDDYSKSMYMSHCKCVYIPNIIDVDSPAISKLNNNTLINVSRLSNEKGLFDLIDVVTLVKKQISDIKLELIGDGVLFDKLKKYVIDNDMNHSVIFYGFQNSDFIYKHLSKSSLYVMTSFTESFGISLLEAFSHGVPAIAFDSASGANELITYKDLLVSKRNKKEMAIKIIDLLNNRNKLKYYGKESLKIYEKYTPNNIIPEWINLIN